MLSPPTELSAQQSPSMLLRLLVLLSVYKLLLLPLLQSPLMLLLSLASWLLALLCLLCRPGG